MISIKTEAEITFLREGGRRLGEIISQVCSIVRPGIKTSDLDNLAKDLIAKLGDKPSFFNYQPRGARRPFPANSCISVNEEIIHGIPTENPRILNDGDIVGIDIGLNHKNMFTDSAVSIGVGKIDLEAEKLLRATKEALYTGIAEATVGKNIGDIGHAISKVAKREGYFIAENLCGHGVGKSVHEDPYVPNFGEKGEGPELKVGMVLAIEPMFNLGTGKTKLMPDGFTHVTANGKKSAHFEHTILVTKKEPEVLTFFK